MKFPLFQLLGIILLSYAVCYIPFCHINAIGLQIRSINILEHFVITPSQICKYHFSRKSKFLGQLAQKNLFFNLDAPCLLSHSHSAHVACMLASTDQYVFLPSASVLIVEIWEK